MTPSHSLRLLLLSALCLSSTPLWGQPAIREQTDSTLRVQMEVGQTRLLRLSDKIVRVSIADPNVADVRVVTPLQVLVTAKAVGMTHLILWGENDKPLVVAVVCQRNLDELRSQVKELFPGETIKVGAVGELVVLSGKVSDLRIPARVAEVAKLHSKQLANLVEVSGDQQVQLEVRFAEVSRTGLRRMGFTMFWNDPGRGYMAGYAGSTIGQFMTMPVSGNMPPVMVPAAGDAFNMVFSTGLNAFPFSAVLSILAQEGLAKVLAEPTLVALSGSEASFHAGGEVPLIIAQQWGTFTVTFKKFGVLLKFLPTVLGGKTMSLKISSEVSEPDPTLGVVLASFNVPGFRTRTSDTTVRLKDGQSFAIAGLLSDSTRSSVRKIPLLGEIPVLGALFRSTSFQREESELLVVVKAHLTQPIQVPEVPQVPGEDEINDPGDFQLFLMGNLGPWKRDRKERREGDGAPHKSGGPAGPIGFMRE